MASIALMEASDLAIFYEVVISFNSGCSAAMLLVWLRGRVVSRSGRYSLDLFVYLLQLKFEKFAPDDPLLDRLSKERILPVVTD